MVKKKNSVGRRRKKLNTTTNKGAKHSKTEDNKNPAEWRVPDPGDSKKGRKLKI